MDKKILFVSFMVLMLLSLVQAEPVFYVEDEEKVTVCQGEMGVLTAFLKNDGNEQQRFFLRAEGEENEWVSAAPKNITLGAGESGKAFLFITPEKLSSGREYSFDLIAYNDDYEISQSFDVEVKNCHKFNIKVEEEMKGCVGEAVEFPIYIENEGRYTDDVNLQITVGEADRTESFNLTLAPKDTKSVKIKFTPTEVGNYSFDYSLRVVGLEDYVEEATTNFISERCAGADIELESLPSDLCIGEETEILFNIKNTGNTKDVFTFSSPELNIITEKVELDPDEEYELVADYIPTSLSEKVVLSVESEEGFSDNKSFTLKAETCCDTSLISPPGEITVCKGEMAQLDIRLALLNNAVPATYNIESQYEWLHPQTQEVKVDRDEEKEFFARVRIPDKVGSYRSVITASSDQCEDKAHVSLNVENCYSFDANLDVEDEECSCSQAEMELEIENTGGVTDTYKVTIVKPYQAEIGSYELNPDETKTVTIPYNTSCEGDEEEIIVKVSSKANPLLSEVIEETIDLEDCFGFEIKALEKVDFCANEKRSLKLYVENTGTSEDTFSITPLCPPWVDAEKEEIDLDEGENETFVYDAEAPESTDKEAFCSFRVVSEKGNVSKVVSTILKVLSNEDCYCFEASLEKDSITFEDTNKTNQVVDLEITNCGRSQEEFSLEVFGDLRHYVETKPETLQVNPQETDAFHIGVSLPLEGETGDIELQLTAENSNKKEDFTLVLE